MGLVGCEGVCSFSWGYDWVWGWSGVRGSVASPGVTTGCGAGWGVRGSVASPGVTTGCGAGWGVRGSVASPGVTTGGGAGRV